MKLTKVQIALKAIAKNMPDETLVHNSRGVLPAVADSLEKSGYIEVEWEGDENSRPRMGYAQLTDKGKAHLATLEGKQ